MRKPKAKGWTKLACRMIPGRVITPQGRGLLHVPSKNTWDSTQNAAQLGDRKK